MPSFRVAGPLRALRIRFLTHPRNANRRDLRCPFGCRQHHRREEAKKRRRSTPNARGKTPEETPQCAASRSPSAVRPSEPDLDPHPEGAPPGEPTADALQGTAVLRLEGVVLNEASVANSRMLPYVRMVVGLIEGIAFTCREVVELLRLAMRQHRRASGRSPYAWCFPSQRPP